MGGDGACRGPEAAKAGCEAPKRSCRESARQNRRRRAYYEVRAGLTSREPLDAARQKALLKAIDKDARANFGIESLSKTALDDVVGPIPGCRARANWSARAARRRASRRWVKSRNGEGKMTLLRYAALRGRGGVVEMLLRGGADALAEASGFQLLEEDEVDAAEKALDAVTERRRGKFDDASSVLICLARMVEGAAQAKHDVPGEVHWRWVEIVGGRRYELRGCGCAVAASVALATLCEPCRTSETALLACPVCGIVGLPAPVVVAQKTRAPPDADASRARATLLTAEDRAHHQDALFRAARYGDVEALLDAIDAGVDVDARDETSATAAVVAAARGDLDFLEALKGCGADLDVGARSLDTLALDATPDEIARRRRDAIAAASRLRVPGANGLRAPRALRLDTRNAFVAHGAATEADIAALVGATRGRLSRVDFNQRESRSDLAREYSRTPLRDSRERRRIEHVGPVRSAQALVALHSASPVLPSERNTKVERRHWFDAYGVVEALVAEALPGARIAPRCKFLRYEPDGAEMAPHVDLSKSAKEIIGAPKTATATTHTWILYLDDSPDGGGATALLRDLKDPLSLVDLVVPKRGSILAFPHRTPHAGRPTNAAPKLILRGELLFLDDPPPPPGTHP